ncbi:hypothetical protein JKF63_01935 [Porcisia hertigi]|uniref:Uncharacterized protein n=1 Tax=Porcisia hertigi TaxID=2761500 RepID=A0A836I0B4_9TRYP|nr:hypothetical protein JKF63_01935 [Porcisia hertigi]
MPGEHTVTRAPATLGAKPSAYAKAADQNRYRVADAVLFTCAEHGDACVLCVTAGKNGRNGRTAAVGATLFWLTCPNLNAIIARLEGHRGVQAVTEAMAQQTSLCEWHVHSHDDYTVRAKGLLSPAQWAFFDAHFLSQVPPPLRKYGNAAVGHPTDVKCLHALVAQTLAGVSNPAGSIVVNYVLLQYQLANEPVEMGGVEQQSDEEKRSALRGTLDSREFFMSFIVAFVRAASERHMADWRGLHGTHIEILLPEGNVWSKGAVQYMWQDDSHIATLCPDFCARARSVLVALEGTPPRRHKKHRIN